MTVKINLVSKVVSLESNKKACHNLIESTNIFSKIQKKCIIIKPKCDK